MRHIYNKISSETPSIPDNNALSLAFETANNTFGSRGLFPTLLVLGITPRLPLTPQFLRVNYQRVNILRFLKQEMAQLVSRERIGTALARHTLSAADTPIQIGDEVLWYRDNPVGRWTGSLVITAKQYPFSQIGDENAATASIHRVR